MKKKGKVYLVGAGPGDPGLITVRGAQLLAQADVVVYDSLANPKLLEYLPDGAEPIYAGKNYQKHTLTQEEINKLLVLHGRKGKRVVRLKGGDPFIFGRGGEEAAALSKAKIDFEIVPGITSAIAGPAYAGIPVTHRDTNSLFSIITGHEDPLKENSHLDWKKIANPHATLVFLMGVGQMPHIARKLILHGMEPETPVAVISWATWPQQRTLVGTLENIGLLLQEKKVVPPAVIVVGNVVREREKIAWFERRPLFGRRIVVTRARAQASEVVSILAEKGAEVLEFPTIKIKPLKSYSLLDQELKTLSSCDWLIFTSVNGVHFFLKRLKEKGHDIRSLAGVKLCAIGPATQEALEEKGLKVDLIPKEFVAESVVKKFKESIDLKGKKILIPRAQEARELLAQELHKLGAKVKEVPVYETVVDQAGKEMILEKMQKCPPHAVTFTSSSTVKNFIELVGKKTLKSIFKETKFVSIGPVTTKTAKSLGIKVAAQAKEHTIPGLIEAIEKLFIRKEHGHHN